MKILLLIVISATLFSCGNKKAKLVEQVKAYNDSLGVIAKQEAELQKEITAAQEKYVGQQSLDSVAAIKLRQSPLKAELMTKSMIFDSKIDSLELELQKY